MSSRRAAAGPVALFMALALVLMAARPAVAGNRWLSWHWPQNSGGGLSRWVPYHDHTDSSVFGEWFQHTMGHYYDANNRWYPYRVCNTCASNISGYSDRYPFSWYGETRVVQNSGWHFVVVEIFFNEATASGLNDAKKHRLMCQEDGHAGGLDHRQSTDTCMYEYTDVWPQDFDQHDTSALYAIYEHSD